MGLELLTETSRLVTVRDQQSSSNRFAVLMTEASLDATLKLAGTKLSTIRLIFLRFWYNGSVPI